MIDPARLTALWTRKGGSVRAMARELGCEERSLYRLARDMGLPCRARQTTGKPWHKKAASKPAADPKPVPQALCDRADYPALVAAIRRGVSVQWAAAVFRLPYGVVQGLAGGGG